MADQNDFQRQEFERRRNEPNYWYNKSSDLRAAAGVIWCSMETDVGKRVADHLGFGVGFDMGVACHPVFPMMCGLSLELVYKALCVVQRIDFRLNHNLLELADKAGIQIKDGQKSILQLYTSSVYWYGKYPTPSTAQSDDYQRFIDMYWETLSEPDSTSSTLAMRRFTKRLDWETFNSLWLPASDMFFSYGAFR